MSATKTPARKRSRPSLRSTDELTTEVTSTPLSSVKKPKLSAPDPSPAVAPPSNFLQKLNKRWFGSEGAGVKTGDSHNVVGALGEGNGNGNRATIGEASPMAALKRKYTKKTQMNEPIGVAQDAESTDEDEPTQQKKRGRPSKRAMLSKAKSLARKAARERLEAAADEAEDSHGETPKKPKGRQSEIIESSTAEPKGILTPSKRKRGRPRKNVAFENEANEDVNLGFKDLPPSAKKARKGDLNSSKANRVTKPDAASSEKSIYDFMSSDTDGETRPTPQTSVRASKPAAGSKKRLNGTASKGAADDDPSIYDFEGSDSEENLSARTPKRQASRPKSTPHPKKAVLKEVSEGISDVDTESEDEEDDEVCQICGDAESEEPNLIIFCETCPLAVHQECYDVPVVPEGDWFCKDCHPETYDDHILPISNDVVDDHEPTELLSNLPDIEGSEKYLAIMQRLVLSKLTGEKRLNLRGHDEEMQKVHQLVEQTVLAGEGNSMLVIGARGCGKTTLVESVISDLSVEHRESFHVIRLNGFIHTDDKLALREIWRQLGREMEVEDDVTGKPSNHADTLASLLALLSHPSEISEDQAEQTAKSVIFILDEFDLFTTHPRQTLLYNLFDIAQARKAPIAVLGLTTRIDVVEALEKRVKSRFSHRYVHLSLPRSLPAFWEICKDGLVVDPEEFESETDTDLKKQDEFLSCWQAMIENLYNNDTTFKQHLQAHFYRTKSAPAFFTSCILPIASLSPKSFPLTGRSFASTKISLSAPDSKLHILQGLSDVELALLISAARLDIILDTDTCNFAMAYDEYSSLTSRHKIQTSSTGVTALGASAKVWGREVALSAWERLSEYDLLVPASMGGGAREVGVGGRMWKVDIGLEEISGSVDGLSSVMAKWCREI